MNPYVEPALIAGGVSLLSLGGTVWVALAGFRNTRKATTQTVEAGTADTVLALDAARGDRLWHKQTASYEETNAYLLFRQVKRRYELSPAADQPPPRAIEELFSHHKAAEWFAIQGRLVTYAEDVVVDAYNAAHFADSKVYMLYRTWKELKQQSEDYIAAGDVASAQDGAAGLGAAADAIGPALKDAEEKDQALIKLIRRELRRKPSAPLPDVDESATAKPVGPDPSF